MSNTDYAIFDKARKTYRTLCDCISAFANLGIPLDFISKEKDATYLIDGKILLLPVIGDNEMVLSPIIINGKRGEPYPPTPEDFVRVRGYWQPSLFEVKE